MKVVYQQVLRGLKSSNRGFRYRRLKASEVDALDLKAGKLLAMKGDTVDPDTRAGLFRQIRYNEGVKMMLVAVTKKPVPVPELPPKDPDTGKQPEAAEPDLSDESLWQPVDVGTLTVAGEFCYDELFEAPDHNHLKTVFIVNHEADLGEVDSVLKKERTVSTG